MSKKLISHIADTLIWWIVWLLPIIGGIIVLATNGAHDYTVFADFMDNFTFTFVSDMITNVFNIASISIPVILRVILSWFVSVEICHVFVDVLVFIPRFAHKLVTIDTYVDVEKGGKRR